MTGARSEVKNNALHKGLDAVRQYASKLFKTAESGVDKVVSSCEKNPSVHLRQRKTALDAPLYAVSSGRLRSQCAPDAKGFLSDVYKSSTLAKKLPADGVQGGRSMIEMLGVLAIIAVLSVGGIAGYSKAMRKFKVNKTIDEITNIITNIRTLYANEKKFSFSTALYPLIVSDNYLKDNNIYHPFGGNVFIYESWISSNDNYFKGDAGAFAIRLTQLYRQECIELASLDWSVSDGGLIGLTVGVGYSHSYETDTSYPVNCTVGKKNNGYNNNYACAPNLPLTPATAAKWCDCGKENVCGVSLKFRL